MTMGGELCVTRIINVLDTVIEGEKKKKKKKALISIIDYRTYSFYITFST